MKRSFKLIIMMAIICQSCQQELPPAGITVMQEAVNASSIAGVSELEFISTRPWTVNISSDWCRIVPESGGGGSAPTRLKVICEKNQTTDDRTCQFTITSEGIVKHVNIFQSCSEGVLVDRNFHLVSDQEQTFDIHFWKKTSYTAEVEGDARNWIKVLSTKSMDNASLSISIACNTGDMRDGIIRLRSGSQEESITIRQVGHSIVFKDKVFNDYCLEHFDKNNDGELTYEELMNAKSLYIYSYSVLTRDYLYFFPNLDEVSFTATDIAADLSMFPLLSTVFITGSLTDLDLSKNPLLKRLIIKSDKIKTLDLTHNPLCRSITIYTSRNLTTIYLIKGIEYDIEYDPSITTLIYK